MSAFETVVAQPSRKVSWFAVKVRVRCEEAIAATLRGKQYEVLSPSFTESRQYSDRTRKVSCALFSGYVFVAMNPKEMLSLLSTQGVNYVVRSGTDVHPLSHDEIHAIKALCQMEAQQSQSCRPCDYLRVGQRVGIEAGPLAGLEGILVRVRDVNRVIVTVESLHSAVSVEIGHTKIRVLDDLPLVGNKKCPSKSYGLFPPEAQTSKLSSSL